ncbi:MAG TPA: thiol peroxidase [Candidatus Krumholzibacteria bacterium]|nr:thiol peroxidase [Candidatus Krumholzibacteria bacterium]HPD72872.1 thiol peroxidase [Candidatus Krumholzibacteria bacterium]HRY41671.1 thiol peroxidase [Candidatus Krumholzibacteria bacterium]
MAKFKLKGNPFNTVGSLPAAGTRAPDFTLVGANLAPVALADYAGRRVILNVFPSLDTDVCAASVRRFNEEAARLDRVTVLCISMDLPFAAGRFCAAEGIEHVVTASDFREGAFGRAYGMRIADGPLAGLLARSVILLDGSGKVMYTELVPETTQEPNYGAVLALLA